MTLVPRTWAGWLLLIALSPAWPVLAADAERAYVELLNPYEAVDWEASTAHRANFHAHTTNTDGRDEPEAVLRAYAEAGWRAVALTDHNYVSWPWPVEPEELNLVAIDGNEISGTHHILSLFSEFEYDGYREAEALAGIGEAGGLAVFAHPGRYAYDVDWYIDFYERFEHLAGMEVVNSGDLYDDRALWDALLERFMPDRPIWGFGNDDMHALASLGDNWNVFPLVEADRASMREAMESGAFYFKRATRDEPPPRIEAIETDEAAGTVRLVAPEAGHVVWIANGQVVHEGEQINYRRDLPREAAWFRAELRASEDDEVCTATNPFGVRRLNVSAEPAGGGQLRPATVNLRSSVPRASIRYTLDGDEPTTDSPLYDGPLTLDEIGHVELQARAFVDGYEPGPVMKARYDVGEEWIAPLKIAPEPGRHIGPVHVRLGVQQPGAEIRYTLDGSDPREAGRVYVRPIELRRDETHHVRAIATTQTGIPSEIEATYHLVSRIQTPPTIQIEPDTRYELQRVRMRSAYPEAEIRYTLDGGDPGPASALYRQPLTPERDARIRARVFHPTGGAGPAAEQELRFRDRRYGPGIIIHERGGGQTMLPMAEDNNIAHQADEPRGRHRTITLRITDMDTWYGFRKGLFRPDLDALADVQTIDAASFRFRVRWRRNSGEPATLRFHRMLRPWDAESTYQSLEGFYAGEHYEAEPFLVHEMTSVPVGLVTAEGFEQAIEKWRDGTWENHGFVAVVEGPVNQINIDSTQEVRDLDYVSP